jgi:hypothetical protein
MESQQRMVKYLSQLKANVAKQRQSEVAWFILVLGIISYIIIMISGISLINLESVAGNSVAEFYYNGIGWALIGFAQMILGCSIFFLTALQHSNTKNDLLCLLSWYIVVEQAEKESMNTSADNKDNIQHS